MPLSAKVLFLVENNSYPFDFRVRREAQALHSAGYQVTVIAPRDIGQLWTETVEGIKVYRFPAPPGGGGLLSYALEFCYATVIMLLLTLWVAVIDGVDIVHTANPPDTLFLIGLILKTFGKRFVFDQHDLSPETYLSRFLKPRANCVYDILCSIERLSYAVADVVIVTNESYKQVAIKRGKVNPANVFVVRNGPPLAYQPLEVDSAFIRRTTFLVGYVGTIGPQDGVDYWMRAIREMVVTLGRRDFLAIVIGSGDALPSVRDLAKTLEIEAYVLFTGRLSESDSRRYLSAVDVCVQPDPLSPLNDKSTMNKLMEYMALGKPTVAFDLVETRFSAEGAALYVQPNDVLEFAERVIWLLDNPEEGRKMGSLGRTRVMSTLAWEYSVPELLKAYGDGLGFHVGYPPKQVLKK